MYRWGHIRSFRFDNGRPFGDPKRETISPLALTLIAHGSQVIFNPPRTPTKNAKVERAQGTTGKWADAKNCANIDQFREQLDYAVIAQRERFLSRRCKGKTRMQYYPKLRKNPRQFNSMDFQPQRAFDFLIKGQWYRKVSAVGQINLFAHNYQLGYAYRHQRVLIKLDKVEKILVWKCWDKHQNLIKQIPAKNLSDLSYFNLEIS